MIYKPFSSPKEAFINALNHGTPRGRVPHFELVFFLTMEVFGKVHPTNRVYENWMQMEEKERQLHRIDMADLFIDIAERYDHSAIFVHPNPWSDEETALQCQLVKERSGGKYFIMVHGDCTFPIPTGNDMIEFIADMYENPDKLLDKAKKELETSIKRAEYLKKCDAIDGFALCADYCMNDNPFLSPEQFSVFVAPFLKDLIAAYTEMGFYSIKHTDGNIMPIIDQIIDCKPHALHSLDPQGHVDIAEVKKMYGDKVCLIGNVNCGALDTGTEEQVEESVRYALKHGMPGGGYIFSTSNCIYTGMRLERYHLIHRLWQQLGNYPE